MFCIAIHVHHVVLALIYFDTTVARERERQTERETERERDLIHQLRETDRQTEGERGIYRKIYMTHVMNEITTSMAGALQ